MEVRLCLLDDAASSAVKEVVEGVVVSCKVGEDRRASVRTEEAEEERLGVLAGDRVPLRRDGA